MTDSDVIRTRILEIRDKIDLLEEQIYLKPLAGKEMRGIIKELRDELERLESECHWQTTNIELN